LNEVCTNQLFTRCTQTVRLGERTDTATIAELRPAGDHWDKVPGTALEDQVLIYSDAVMGLSRRPGCLGTLSDRPGSGSSVWTRPESLTAATPRLASGQDPNRRQRRDDRRTERVLGLEAD